MKVRFINRFWIAGDVMISAATGATQETFHFVNNAEDASAFGRATAQNIKSFVETRVNNLHPKQNPIKFEVVASEFPIGLWIVRAEQEVELESTS